MEEKKNKIILWGYLGLMVCFILLVTFGGEEKSHAPATDTQIATEAHAAPEATPAAIVTQEKTHADTAVLNNETEKHPAQDQENVAEKEESHVTATDAPEAHVATTATETSETHAAVEPAHGVKNPFEGKPSPEEAIHLLKKGNQRFVHGESAHPHMNLARLLQAGSENQGDHAYATVLTCSDSRVPVEAIFDAGIMDIFVIRVAGNVCDVDERGSIEYGLAHVNTPVLVVLGHTQCGAVTAVTQAVLGQGHALERNIPALVDNIIPAVKKAMADHPEVKGTDIIPMAIEENIWTGIEELFMESPATRNLVTAGQVKVLGAIYDVGEGTIQWLPQEKSMEILKKVEENPQKATIK
jgi:carbonic anhydrase